MKPEPTGNGHTRFSGRLCEGAHLETRTKLAAGSRLHPAVRDWKRAAKVEAGILPASERGFPAA